MELVRILPEEASTTRPRIGMDAPGDSASAPDAAALPPAGCAGSSALAGAGGVMAVRAADAASAASMAAAVLQTGLMRLRVVFMYIAVDSFRAPVRCGAEYVGLMFRGPL